MEARDNVGGAGDHVNGELFKELTINAGEDEETDDISSSFKVRQHEKSLRKGDEWVTLNG